MESDDYEEQLYSQLEMLKREYEQRAAPILARLAELRGLRYDVKMIVDPNLIRNDDEDTESSTKKD